MTGFFIVVVNRGTHGELSADFIITSCENSRTDTTNGINITTTNVQNGQPVDKTFKYVCSFLILNRFIIIILCRVVSVDKLKQRYGRFGLKFIFFCTSDDSNNLLIRSKVINIVHLETTGFEYTH